MVRSPNEPSSQTRDNDLVYMCPLHEVNTWAYREGRVQQSAGILTPKHLNGIRLNFMWKISIKRSQVNLILIHISQICPLRYMSLELHIIDHLKKLFVVQRFLRYKKWKLIFGEQRLFSTWRICMNVSNVWGVMPLDGQAQVDGVREMHISFQ
jgi:hypothetical protein